MGRDFQIVQIEIDEEALSEAAQSTPQPACWMHARSQRAGDPELTSDVQHEQHRRRRSSRLSTLHSDVVSSPGSCGEAL